MGTHNLCFGAKIRKIGIPLHTPVLLYKVGFKGVFIARTCFHDVLTLFLFLISKLPYPSSLLTYLILTEKNSDNIKKKRVP